MLSSSVGSWIQGCGGCHSKGVTLQWGGLKEDGRTDVRETERKPGFNLAVIVTIMNRTTLGAGRREESDILPSYF